VSLSLFVAWTRVSVSSSMAAIYLVDYMGRCSPLDAPGIGFVEGDHGSYMLELGTDGVCRNPR
jgi:hypothetical protein